jgi:hypothetical protein
MKVPLVRREGTPYAVGIGSKRQVTVGFEIEDFSATGERGRMGGRRGAGGRGMPHGGGGMGGGRGMAGGTGMDDGSGTEDGTGMGGPEMSQPRAERFTEQRQVSLWILVRLASPVSTGGG